jgi:hypothetical protein
MVEICLAPVRILESIVKRKILVTAVAAIVTLLFVSATPAFAALTLTLSDGNPLHDQTFTDSGSPGSISADGVVVGNWSLRRLSGFFGSDPLLDLTYNLSAPSGNSTTLTVTLTESGFGPLTSPTGEILLAIGGTDGTSTATQNGMINGSIIGSQGPLSGASYDGSKQVTVSGLAGSAFSISEQLIFTGFGHDGGDATLDLAGVPEPSTVFSGIFAGICGLCFVARTAVKSRHC